MAGVCSTAMIVKCFARVLEFLGRVAVLWPIVRGATTFSKLGVQFLGLCYYTEQSTDNIPSFMHCSLQLRKKLGWSVQILGVQTPPPTPQWLRPCLLLQTE